MAINERLIHTASDTTATSGNQEEELILHLDANDVDSYDGTGTVWYDISDHEFTPTENPEEHFNTVLYTGDGNTSGQSITGVGFQPDLTILKSRVTLSNNTGGSWMWFDSVRGPSNWNRTDSVMVDATTNGLASFDTDGFTTSNGYIYSNQNARNYVAYNLKAGGAPTATNTGGQYPTSGSKMIDGSADNTTYPTADTYPNKLTANTKLGFSIVDYTASLTASVSAPGHSIPHGLNQPPEMIIWKSPDRASDYIVAHKELPNYSNLVRLNTSAASTEYYSSYPMDAPTNSVFYTNWITGMQHVAGEKTLAYCFHSVRGISKVGAYNGSYSSTPVEVYTGFEPAFIMVKAAHSTGTWSIHDNKRGVDKQLNPDLNSAETTGWSAHLEFTRDGFTVKGASSGLNKNEKMLYYAVAKNTNETELVELTPDLHLDPASYSGSGTTWTADVGNDATITGATYDEELGDWFDFDGSNDYVDLGTASSIIPAASDFTVESWVNPKSISDSTYWAVVSSVQSISPYGGFMLYFHHTTDHWGIAMNGGGTWYSKDTGVDVVINKWVHLVFTYNGSNMKLFVNGEEKYTFAQTNSLQYSNAPNLELARNTSTYSPIKIGQTRLYSEALSTEAIRQNFNFTKSNYPNGMHFDNAGGRANWLTEGSFNFDTGQTGGEYFKIAPSSRTFLNALGYGPFAVSAWVYPDEVTSGYRVIIGTQGYSDGSNNGWQMYAYQDDIRFWVNSATEVVTLNGVLTAGMWSHVLIQRTEAKWEGYIDGALVSNASSANETTQINDDLGHHNPSDAMLIIGRNWQNTNYQWDGRISEIKIYNKSLSSDKIQAEYDKGQFGNN